MTEHIEFDGGRLGDKAGDIISGRGAGGSSSGVWSIPEEGITVRFLTEPTEWRQYFEVWDGTSNRFRILKAGEVRPPGTSERFLAVAWHVEREQAIAVRLPKTAAEQVYGSYELVGTITDRDYVLGRKGAGKNTTYAVVPMSPEAGPAVKEDDLPDLNEVLLAEYHRSQETVTEQADPFTPEDHENPVYAKAKEDPDPDPSEAQAAPVYRLGDIKVLSGRELTQLAMQHGVDVVGRDRAEIEVDLAKALEQ